MARSLSPEVDPLAFFIKQSDGSSGSSVDEDKERDGPEAAKEPFSSHLEREDAEGGLLIPEQRPSIIDESAVVRFYTEAARKPIIISDGLQGNAPRLDEVQDKEAEKARSFDVSLALDVTRGCGGKIWPAAEVLGQYIAVRRSIDDQWRGKEAVELGSGTGLVGFLAAAATPLSKVWVTDQVPMLPLMQRNLALNAGLQDRCKVAELNWGEEVPHDIPSQPDILLLADCVYLEVAFQPLVDTLRAMSSATTEILFCYQQRRKADKRFFKLLKKHFTFGDIQDDDPVRQREYNRQGTHLYRVTKKSG